jgi:hypothetical protein
MRMATGEEHAKGAAAASVRELVERACQGDEGAFACLVEQCRPGLARFCRRLMVGAGILEDLGADLERVRDETLGALARGGEAPGGTGGTASAP